MRRNRASSRRSLRRGTRHNSEQGFVIALVAVFLLVVVGAMAALAIDVVTFYTARSEAQLAADSAALAGARVLANSGVTSDPTAGAIAAAQALARNIASQVAQQNRVGGAPLTAANVVSVVFAGSFSNPTVTVSVQVPNLPTFFARILGTRVIAVGASATAEAYNPSALPIAANNAGPPVSTICVKPWLLPNIDPTQPATALTPPTIFNSGTGAITNSGLVGKSWPSASTTPGNPEGLYAACSDCSPGAGGIAASKPGQYYPGDASDFPAPTQGLPSCSASFSTNAYQLAIAGCVQQPISCGSTATGPVTVKIDTTAYGNKRDDDTVKAAACLIHYNNTVGDTDSIDPLASTVPFHFLGGSENPVTGAVNKDILVSDSLVTIPVVDVAPGATPGQTVTVIGFVQGFLNHQSASMPLVGTNPNEIPVTIINLAGCGTSATGNPIFGNGASPVAVRLITSSAP